MKTVIDAVNEFKGVWPDDSRNELVTTTDKWDGSKSYIGTIEVRNDIDIHGSGQTLNNTSWVIICTKAEFHQCVVEMIDYKPEPKPIYTQAMKNHNIKPMTGMECEWKHHSTNVVLTFIGDEMFCGKNDSGKESSGYISDLKPLTPPIELIDRGLYYFDVGKKKKLVGEAYLTAFTESWMINALRTNSSYEAINCTNIVLLTPEVNNES